MNRLENESEDRSSRTPYTTSAPLACSSSIAAMAPTSSCPSQSIVTVASQPMSRASIRPAHSAAWCPRLRLCRMPMKRGFSAARREIVRHVPSSLPSSTNSILLSCEILPEAARASTSPAKTGAVAGSVSSSS